MIKNIYLYVHLFVNLSILLSIHLFIEAIILFSISVFEKKKMITIITQRLWFYLPVVIWIVITGELILCKRQYHNWCREQLGKRLIKLRTGQSKQPIKNCEKIQQSLLQAMEKKKPYLKPDLKVADLAKTIRCRPHELTKVLNISMQQSFTVFINTYRIKEFKEKLQKCEYEEYCFVEIAEQCGFSSPATFFRTFKKLTGTTPLGYLKEMKGQNNHSF